MARLPQPGGDTGTWGDILNEYLQTVHNSDGTLKDNIVTAAKLAPGAVDGSSVSNGSLTPAKLNADTPASGEVLSYNGSGFEWITVAAATGSGEANTASNVGTGGVGIYKQKVAENLELKSLRAASNKVSVVNNTSNDTVDIDVNTANLGVTKADVGLGNVDNTSDLNKPLSTATTSALAGKEGSIVAGTTAQYWRGDKSWQTLDKTAVGLANVENTSDANKPVSTATQTALNAKVNTSAVGAANGVASLDATGKVPSAQLPTAAAPADATTTSKGIVQLTGDLGGTATAPTVPGLANKANTTHSHAAADITSGTVAVARLGTGTADSTKFLRGDGSWATPTGSSTGVSSFRSVSAGTTAVEGEMLNVNASGGLVSIAMPDPSGIGKQILIKKTDATNNAVMMQHAGHNIDTSTAVILNNQGQSITFVSDGTMWWGY